MKLDRISLRLAASTTQPEQIFSAVDFVPLALSLQRSNPSASDNQTIGGVRLLNDSLDTFLEDNHLLTSLPYPFDTSVRTKPDITAWRVRTTANTHQSSNSTKWITKHLLPLPVAVAATTVS